MANPTGKGGFKKGRSGNPGGRPKEVGEVRELAKEHTREAVETLAQVMRDGGAPPAARVAAASSLLDRGWGKATQPVDMNVKGSFADFIASLGLGTGEAAVPPMEGGPGGVRH